MKIKWFGHASFLITSEKGTRIITDPYTPGGPLTYGPVKEAADAVTISHEHGDHNDPSAITGKPTILKASGQVKGITFKGIPTFHDEESGKKRGTNVIFCFEVDGIKVCHLGDLGHQLTEKQVADIGKVDILFVPVGGFYTIDAAGASRVADEIKPKVIIPMHFKTEKCGYPIATSEAFLTGKKDVKKVEGSEIEFKTGALPAAIQVIVLKPAL